MKRLIVLGAGGHAREVLWTANRTQTNTVIYFFDETITAQKTLYNLPIVNDLSEVIEPDSSIRLISGVGNNQLRLRWAQKFSNNYVFTNIIDPSSIINSNIHMGEGNLIMAGCIISDHVTIGNHTILHFKNVITHDCIIEDYCFVGPGCNLAGNVHIDTGAHLGAGVTIIPNCKIGKWSILGAGSVVTSDIPAYCLALGVPAKVIKKINQ